MTLLGRKIIKEQKVNHDEEKNEKAVEKSYDVLTALESVADRFNTDQYETVEDATQAILEAMRDKIDEFIY